MSLLQKGSRERYSPPSLAAIEIYHTWASTNAVTSCLLPADKAVMYRPVTRPIQR